MSNILEMMNCHSNINIVNELDYEVDRLNKSANFVINELSKMSDEKFEKLMESM